MTEDLISTNILQGQSVVVEANHFPVTGLSNLTVIQYEVIIGDSGKHQGPQARRLPREFCKEVWNSKQVQAAFEKRRVIYDENKLAWSLGPLPFGNGIVVSVSGIASKSDLLVTIRKVAEINMDVLSKYLKRNYAKDDSVIQCVNVISQLLRQRPSERFTSVGRGFYPDNFESLQLPRLVQARRGIYQSVRPTLGNLNVIVDITTRVFWQNIGEVSMMSLIERVTNSDPARGMPQDQLRRINSLFCKMKFYTTYMKRDNVSLKKIYTFNNLGRPANMLTFIKDEQKVTVAQHFKDAWKYNLKYPNLPVVIVQNQNRTAIPLELCFVNIDGMTALGSQPDASQMAELIKFACVGPMKRKAEIKKNVEALKWQNDPYLKEFGMEISHNMVKINARLLSPPSLEFARNPRKARASHIFKPIFGKWDREQQDLSFIEPKSVLSWAIISYARRIRGYEDAKPFVDQLTNSASHAGMSFGTAPPAFTTLNPAVADLAQDVKSFLVNTQKKSGKPIGMVFIIVEDKNSQLYPFVKSIFYTAGITSQVITAKNLCDARPNLCRNVIMKVNQKLGGINNKLPVANTPFADKPTLVLGADVSHAAPGSQQSSLPSVVGCIDFATCKWVGRVGTQTSRQEMIADMKNMAKEIIQQWIISNKKHPQRIVYFRDGVSDGQYAQVNAIEVKDIEDACTQLKISRPRITVVIATKRHHTRFFPVSSEAADRNGNLVPGTLIEKVVTHPVDFDFCEFLYVIKDENGFKAEPLQNAIFAMCHTFGRSTTSVSICVSTTDAHLLTTVTPIYHAHVIGNQGSLLLQHHSETQSINSGASGDHEPAPLKKISDKLVNLMWWM
ncbi:Protein argonaute [Neolecta irregularis DAH-3]|uniref:Protein argonaute n=1 Tax=Neolecta irregularis (strain DAH-3) TaxID=1198029 RepID=A0A1U7LNG6_NEOID|nr:Protein argonaute [Neolecta irregularis DAH-3]|eukprot:OLL24133.1 Protein argonaute [Neolecta irregularis DAH-3]